MIDEKPDGKFETERKLVRKSLREWENVLGTDFLRISKSIIVNMAYIKRISKNIELKIGKSLNIPRSNLNRCKEFYWNYCQKKMKWG